MCSCRLPYSVPGARAPQKCTNKEAINHQPFSRQMVVVFFRNMYCLLPPLNGCVESISSTEPSIDLFGWHAVNESRWTFIFFFLTCKIVKFNRQPQWLFTTCWPRTARRTHTRASEITDLNIHIKKLQRRTTFS